jgi:hypothetical protein
MYSELASYVRGPYMGRSAEHCRNPWNGKCKNTDIQLYIYYKGKQLPICKECWFEIADRDVQW